MHRSRPHAHDPDQYWGAIARIPLYRERETTDGEGFICRDRSQQPVRVTKPELLTEDERVAAIELYRALYGATTH